ncbi:MAG TPA: RNA 2'-phosphotransferase [Puia sp.]|jgi:putative RNA 2'-phosphotransferase
MNEKEKTKTSKFLSLVLRHDPAAIGLRLDENGWADVNELISKSAGNGRSFSSQDLKEVVVSNDKQRFSFNNDGTKIRANQGHSIEVELQLDAKEPPDLLYHGTVDRFLTDICLGGLKKMSRQHVHLSQDKETAERVGNRRGTAVILVVRSAEMKKDGFLFYLSANGVWLTDHVPADYIDF